MDRSESNKITVGRGRTKTVYTRVDGLVGKSRKRLSADDEVILDDEQFDQVIIRARTSESETEAMPVFRIGNTAEFAMPTGRLFVRIRNRAPLQDSREQIDKEGFRIDRINAWAPHSGWLAPKGHALKHALSKLSTMEGKLDADVEPEMIATRHFKFHTQE